MTSKIQYLSDIHLETRQNSPKTIFEKILKPGAPYLALCGDIGHPKAPLFEPFLAYCSKHFEHVFYVAGNHEFYNVEKAIIFQKYKSKIEEEFADNALVEKIGTKFAIETRQERLDQIRAICNSYPNIHFLDKESFTIPEKNLTIIGCTLWSALQINPFMIESFNDFHRIFEVPTKPIIPATYQKWHEEDVAFLQSEIQKITDTTSNSIIILTHHCPTYNVLIDKYTLSDPYKLNSFFANDNLTEICSPSVKAWLCGHTHGCKQIEENGIIVATNTLGYSDEKIDSFSTQAVINLEI